MGYFTEVEFSGEKYFVGFPQYEFKMFGDGTTFSAKVWPDRKSDCRINEILVNEIVYKRAQREYGRKRAAK